uniref:FBD domain-containing protein n=1 Tax=Solanum lycopersicum TaxID=4081 RepID=A0A3Q7GYH6_SOLLC
MTKYYKIEEASKSLITGGLLSWKSENSCLDVTSVEFPALKYLELHFVRMEEWKASEESFHVLEELSIRSDYFYKEIPSSFADISTLRLIKLFDYTDSLRVSAMNIKKEIEENTGCDSLQVLLLS